jgi:hypothetical protein
MLHLPTLLSRRARAAFAAGLMLATGLFAGAVLAASDEAPGRVGRIAETEGKVWFFDDEAGDWAAAQRNRPLTAGDRLSTERDARAELHIGSATLRLDADTELLFTELDDARVRVQIKQGGVALRLRSTALAREFELVTDEGRFLPLRAGHVRVDARPQSSFATVWQGAMRFDSADSTLEVPAGRRAEFWREGGATHYTWAGADDDAFSEWVMAQNTREDSDERRWAEREISPEMTGVEDLDRYGRWDRHPEYGTVWYPASVAVGWAPYRYGRWAWVRPWGWTWVDDTPWGFAPFHYGRWVMWRDRWCWTPGRYVARPVYSPALVGWIGGPSVSIGIQIGGRPSLPPYVGWVPLAPRDHYAPGYRHRRPDQRIPAPVRTGPIMYGNQGVPGGVTVVPSQVMRGAQPISSKVVSSVDPQVLRNVSRERSQADGPPPAPPAKVVSAQSADARPPGRRIDDDGRDDRIAPPRRDAGRVPQKPRDEVERTAQKPRDEVERSPQKLRSDAEREPQKPRQEVERVPQKPHDDGGRSLRDDRPRSDGTPRMAPMPAPMPAPALAKPESAKPEKNEKPEPAARAPAPARADAPRMEQKRPEPRSERAPSQQRDGQRERQSVQ